MRRTLRWKSWTILLVLLAACSGKPENQSRPGPDTTHASTPTRFAITSPSDSDHVATDVVTIRGTGAVAGSEVVVEVFTDAWYPQSGSSQVEPDGSWAYSPCFLKGIGPFRKHHNIRAKLLVGGQETAVSTAYDVTVD